MNGMAENGTAEAAARRKVVRPVLIASQRNVTEHTTVLRHLLAGLAEQSVPVGLVSPAQCDIRCVARTPLNTFTHPLIDLPILEPFVIEPLAIQLEKFRPTVLHCLCESRATLVRRLATRLDVPYVLSVNSLAYPFGGLPICPRRCARIVAAAPVIAAQIARSHLGLADRIKQINMGTHAQADAVCFSNPSRVPSVIIVCPLNHIARLVPFFATIKALLAEGREFITVVMGSGREDGRLRRHLASAGLSQSVTVVPVFDSWRSVLSASDIFVQPQPSRSFSVFLLEAMALGVAVAACAGGVDSLIVPDQTALVFDPANKPSIRQALSQLLDKHDFARNTAHEGQEYVRSHYAVNATVAAILEMYAAIQRQYGS
jgi:glycosyltransferase involved in cell wall biosynthesis